MHVDLGGYHVRDIEFVAAFDIDAEKVGKDLSEAIWSGQNDTIKFADVPELGVKVERGMTHDGLGKYLKEKIKKAPGPTADIVGILKETKADVLVCYLPVGSEDATKWYVEQALAAGVGFVNCLPVFIAREDYWDKRFSEAGLPIIGDDIKSQVGATIVHRQLARLFHDRGVLMERTSQLNVGGNMDFYNMLERERLDSKKISKTNAVTSIMGHDLPEEDVHVGPSDYVAWLTDRKWAHIRLEGRSFGDVPLNVELKLEVWDSPNSAGVVIDAVRIIKLALNNGIAGQLDGPSSYLMKSPALPAARRRGPGADRGVHRQPTRAAARRSPARRRPRAQGRSRGEAPLPRCSRLVRPYSRGGAERRAASAADRCPRSALPRRQRKVVEVGEGELQAEGRGGGVEVLATDQVGDRFEGGLRRALQRAPHPLEVVGDHSAVGGDLGAGVAEGTAVTREAEAGIETLDDLEAVEELADRIGRVAIVIEEGDAAEQVIAGDHQPPLGLVQDDVGRGVAGGLVDLPGAEVGLDLHPRQQVAIGLRHPLDSGFGPAAVRLVALQRPGRGRR